MTLLLGLLLGLTLASVAYLLLAHRAAARWLRSQLPGDLHRPAPAVAVLKPIEGVGEQSYEAFESFCRLDYPGPLELIFGTLSPEDPVVPLVERLQAAYPELGIRLVIAELQGANRKTSIMKRLAAEARADLLVFSDGDVRVPPDYLRWLVPPLLRPEVGCVTCLPRAVEAHGLGARVVALHYDLVYLPQWAMARETTGIAWAIGKTMAQRREVLDAYGGFDAYLDALADDYEFGQRAHQLGLEVELSPLLVDAYMPPDSLGGAFARLQRWARTIRRARPGQYAGVALTQPLAWSLLLAALHPAPWAAGVLAAVLALRLALAWRLARLVQMPDWSRSWPLLPLVDLLEWLTFWGAYCGNTITWRGRRYRLLPNGDLRPLS